MNGAFGRELTCRALVELVTDYLEDALPAEDRRRVEEHLATCPRCRRLVEALGPALPTLAEAVQAFDDGEVATCRHDSKLSCAYCEQLYCESCSPDHEGDCRARELVKARSALGVLIRFCQQAQLKGKWLPHTDALAKLLEQSP